MDATKGERGIPSNPKPLLDSLRKSEDRVQVPRQQLEEPHNFTPADSERCYSDTPLSSAPTTNPRCPSFNLAF